MQLPTCSQAEQEKRNDAPLPLSLALQSFFENTDELAPFPLKIAENMFSAQSGRRSLIMVSSFSSARQALALRT